MNEERQKELIRCRNKIDRLCIELSVCNTDQIKTITEYLKKVLDYIYRRGDVSDSDCCGVSKVNEIERLKIEIAEIKAVMNLICSSKLGIEIIEDNTESEPCKISLDSLNKAINKMQSEIQSLQESFIYYSGLAAKNGFFSYINDSIIKSGIPKCCCEEEEGYRNA